MKTKLTLTFIAISVLLLISSCGVYNNITTSADVNTDFSKYKTFAWLPDSTDATNQPHNNEIIRNNIRNYVGQSFAERGYTLNLDTPDVLLRVVIVNKKKEKTVYEPYPSPYYYRRYYLGSMYYFPYAWNYYYRYYPGFFYPQDYYKRKVEYIEGAITLDVLDRKSNKLVWSGTARGDIYDPSYINKNIHPAIEAIMRKYPVKPIGSRGGLFAGNDDIYR